MKCNLMELNLIESCILLIISVKDRTINNRLIIDKHVFQCLIDRPISLIRA